MCPSDPLAEAGCDWQAAADRRCWVAAQDRKQWRHQISWISYDFAAWVLGRNEYAGVFDGASKLQFCCRSRPSAMPGVLQQCCGRACMPRCCVWGWKGEASPLGSCHRLGRCSQPAVFSTRRRAHTPRGPEGRCTQQRGEQRCGTGPHCSIQHRGAPPVTVGCSQCLRSSGTWLP